MAALIHFINPGETVSQKGLLNHALFEIGVRLGVPFVIHADRSEIPTDAIVISIGAFRGAEPRWHLLELPSVSYKKCGHIQRDGFDLWACETENSIDPISGCVELVGFSHEQDAINSQLDEFGRIPSRDHPLNQAGVAAIPLLENNVRYIAQRLTEIGVRHQRQYPWGDSNRYVVCLSHDVDGPRLHNFFALTRSLVYALRGDRFERDSLELGLVTLLKKRPDPYWNFEHWLSLEESLGISATYFFYPGCGRQIQRHPRDPRYNIFQAPFPETLKRLPDRGGEVGIHNPINGHHLEGYSDSIARLRGAAGVTAVGSRAHYWANDWTDPYSSWQEMSRAGLLYDSSLSPLSLGYRGGSMLPLTPSVRWGTPASPFVVFPTSIMDSYTVPRTAKQATNTINEDIDRLLLNAQSNSGLLVLDWHVRSLANAGAWQGFLGPLIVILENLLDDSNCLFLSHKKAAEVWQAYCRRLDAGPVSGGT